MNNALNAVVSTVGHTSSRYLVKTRDGIRHCKLCKVRLSQYNQDFYCFRHQIKGQAIEDKKRDKIAHIRAKKNWERCNARKLKKLRMKAIKREMKEWNKQIASSLWRILKLSKKHMIQL